MNSIIRKFAAALTIFLSLLNLSCTKKEPATSEEIASIQEEQEKPLETFQKATVLTEKLYLCLHGRDGKMHKITRLGKTDTIDILYTDGLSESKEIESTIFYRAVHDSCDYWIDGTTLAFNSDPAVIVEKTTLYDDPELEFSPENKTLKFGTIIAISNDENNQTEKSQKIYYTEGQPEILKSAWIHRNSASKREDDIIVMQVVAGLRATKRATARNELFKKAEKYRPCAKVSAALEAEKVELVVNNYQEVLNALPGARIKVNVPELLTVDQSKDPFK